MSTHLGSLLTSRVGSWVAAAVVVAAGIGVYWNSLSSPLVLDDLVSITNNPSIVRLWPLGPLLHPPPECGTAGRPLANLSFALNYFVGGINPFGYRVGNLALHLAAALTLFGVVRRTLGKVFTPALGTGRETLFSFAIVLLWTIHPLHTATVGYVSQRAEVLMGLCYLLTIYAFIRSTEKSAAASWAPVAVLACAAGMASKEVMVTAPVVVLLYDRAFIAGSFRAAWRARARLYQALASTWLLLALLMNTGLNQRGVGFGLGVSWFRYALTEAGAVLTYFRLAVWPHPLIFDYGPIFAEPDAGALGAAALVIALVATSAVALRRWPAVGFAACSVFIILAPTSSVVPVAFQPIAESRTYLPLAPLFALAVLGVHAALGRRGGVALLAIVVGLATVAVGRNWTLRSELTLWADNVASRPENARALGYYGVALADAGRPHEAVKYFRDALERGSADGATWESLAKAEAALHDLPGVIAHYRTAVAQHPERAAAHNGLGVVLFENGDHDAALSHYTEALRLDPNFISAHQNLGRALFSLGRYPEAALHYAEVARLTPTNANAHYDLGLALARSGDIEQAMQHFVRALTLKPDPVAYLNYARFLATVGRNAEALASIESALRLRPGFSEAENERDRIRAMQNRPSTLAPR